MLQGTSSTKTRSEVSGGGRKPYKQKGTGSARAGSKRSPLFVHGGVVFGPKASLDAGILCQQPPCFDLADPKRMHLEEPPPAPIASHHTDDRCSLLQASWCIYGVRAPT